MVTKVYALVSGERRCLTAFADRGTAREDAIRWIEDTLVATTGQSLMLKLNDIQLGCRSENGETLFPDKFTMPLCIVNLVLKEFNLEIKEEKQ